MASDPEVIQRRSTEMEAVGVRIRVPGSGRRVFNELGVAEDEIEQSDNCGHV